MNRFLLKVGNYGFLTLVIAACSLKSDGPSKTFVNVESEEEPAGIVVPGSYTQGPNLESYSRKYFLRGNRSIVEWNSYRIRQYLSKGNLDPLFGNNGVLEIPDMRLWEISFFSDGEMVVCGSVQPIRGGSTITTFRLTANGSLDATFARVQHGPGYCDSLASGPDGKIYFSAEKKLTRLNADGSLDVSFGTGGSVTIDNVVTGVTTIRLDAIQSILVQPDGSVILGGRAFYSGPIPGRTESAVVFRILANGAVDPTFGVDGYYLRRSEFGTMQVVFNAHRKILVVTIGGLVPEGQVNHMGSSILAQLNSDGTLDSNFGSAGEFMLPGRDNELYRLSDVVFQSDGKVIVIGRVTIQSGPDDTTQMAVARLGSDGTLDEKFGNKGLFDDSQLGTDRHLAYLVAPDISPGVALLLGFKPSVSSWFTVRFIQ